jgi:tetratricopeptide (TPR) repeat protein
VEALPRCAAIRERVGGRPMALAGALHPLAALTAMTGDFGGARRLVREGNEILDALGGLPSLVSHHEAFVELLAGDHAAAEEHLRAGYERLLEIGDTYFAATTAALLARAVEAQGRGEEADRYCSYSERAAADDDLPTQVIRRGVRARILARRGLHDEAEALAREAVALAEPTDFLMFRADAVLDLAAVLRACGRRAEADGAGRLAIELHERKGNVTSAERARAQLAATAPA